MEVTEPYAKRTIKTFRDLNVYQLAYELANKIYYISQNFPRNEMYALTDQIRRSSRSIVANIAEGWGKRNYESVFLKHLTYTCEETKVWLDFARDCEYISVDQHSELTNQYNQVGTMLRALSSKWEKF